MPLQEGWLGLLFKSLEQSLAHSKDYGSAG